MGSAEQGVSICTTTLRTDARRLWTLNEIVVPLVPTGTIRCTLAGEASSIAARSSSGRRFRAGLLSEPECGSGAPHPVENDSQLASHRDASASHASRLRDLHAPGAQGRPFTAPHQESVRGLVEGREQASRPIRSSGRSISPRAAISV
jgi:hypothetical protein